MAFCAICGRELKNSTSIEAGIGPICAAKLSKFENYRGEDMRSEYSAQIIEVAGKKVALVIDRDSGGRSVTNDIDNVAKDLEVDYIIYRDSMEVWDFWGERTGFGSLAINGIPTRDMDTAIEVAKVRYFGEIGGLFA